MKRLLRGSKSEKKSDESQSPGSGQKKLWGNGSAAQAASRLRSGSHPQIRHLAMEGHAGPITKATMEEIRRDAPRGSGNFRMNSLGSPVADSIIDASSPEKPMVGSAPLTPSTLEDRHSPTTDKAGIDHATPTAVTAAAVPRALQALHDDVQEVMEDGGEFPVRTTSALVGMSGLTSIDTSPAMQRNGQRTDKLNSAVTVDSDTSIPFGALSGDESGFDRGTGSSAVSPETQAADAANRRVISDRIKNLATRFSQNNLAEVPEASAALLPPPSAPVITRRHSNSPSVSERVSLFDGSTQDSTDARNMAAMFGKFGDASASKPGSSGRHSRSSSVAGISIRNQTESVQLSSAAGSAPASQPQSLMGTLLSASNNQSADDLVDKSPVRHTQALGGADQFPYRVPHMDMAGDSSFASDLGDSEDGEDGTDRIRSMYRPRLQSIGSEPTATIAAGVQVNFGQSQTSLATQRDAGNSGSGVAYRGLRGDGPSKRRGSVRTAFGMADGTQDSLRIVTDPVAMTDSYRGVSPRGSFGAKSQLTSAAAESLISGRSRSPSVTNSPNGTFNSRHGSFRRPGSVVPSVRPGSMIVAPTVDMQKSLSGAPRGFDSVGRQRAFSQTSEPAPGIGIGIGMQASASSSAWELPATPMPELELKSDQALFGQLVQALGTRSFDRLDDALATAVGASSPDHVDREQIALAASWVVSVLQHMGAGKVLAQGEYERYVREVPALKSRLQSARTRLALEMRMRDTAKNLAELHHKAGNSMFKGKAAHQQHAEELSAANAKVQQVEVEITDLSTRLRLMENALRDHEGAVLAGAVRTVAGDAARIADDADDFAQKMHSRCAALERQLADQRSTHHAERDQLVAEHQKTRLALEEQVRQLQARQHELETRRVARETDDSDPETPLTRHSANRAVERLTGELTVLREHKADAEDRARSLEVRLDDALLKAQETRQQLAEVRAQAADMADAAQARLEAATMRADKAMRCVDAFAGGIGAAAPALRELSELRQSALKARSGASADNSKNDSDDSNNESEPGTTMPTTPEPSTPLKFVDSGLSIAELDALLPASPSGRPVEWDAHKAAGAMQLLASVAGGCAGLYAESLKLHETNMQLLMDLGTEKRLREAQGLAIAQQREKLTRASAASETSERRIDEAAQELTAKHELAKAAWADERQRLFDNIERLTQDVKALKSEPIQLRSATPQTAAAATVTAGAVVGSIEHVTDTSHDQTIQDLEQRVSALQSDLDAKTVAVTGLQTQLAELEPLRVRISELEAEVAQLRQYEFELKQDLSDAQAKLEQQDATLTSNETALGDYVQKLKDANALLASETAQSRSADAASPLAPASDELSQVHEMYSLKLMAKEDSLRNREDELEAIRAYVAEIETTLQAALPADPQRSISNMSPPMHGSLPRIASLSPQRPQSRTRTATGFLQGLKSNYLGMNGSNSDLHATQSATDLLQSPPMPHNPLHRVSSTQSLATTNGAVPAAPLPTQGPDGVPQLVSSLVPIAQAASLEVKRLKSLIYELDEQTRLARVELGDTQERYNNLKKHCQVRAHKEDAVQQDIADVLAQITRMREKVQLAEQEKARYEQEAKDLWDRCRQAESKTADQVLTQIVDRLGSADWAKLRHSSPSTPPEDMPQLPAPLPSKFVPLSAISISHPQAAEIRAEFNELLHQVIARRDEDIVRIQAVADAMRGDARKALKAANARAWNTSTRGVQTA